jgi:polysaccharide biosynthesis/export protein
MSVKSKRANLLFRLLKNVLFLLLLGIIGLSCSRFRDITYFRGLGKETSDSLIKTTYTFYKVQPFDVLYIRVSSGVNPEAVEMFNQSISNTSSNLMMTSSYSTGYTVDVSGTIKMPILGDVYVGGMTIKEIETYVHNLVTKYVADADVLVKLTSFKITTLGEIGVGQKTISADRANLLEVFAMSGDISRNGNRHNILLLRTTPEGMRSYRIDVTVKDFISSPLFFVQPNDIIYVEPIKSAAWRFTLSELSLVLTTITTFTSLYFLIVNINK